MPALLMYYWQMKLHCKLFNLNNLVKMPVTSKFSFLQTEMSNMKLSQDGGGEEERNMSCPDDSQGLIHEDTQISNK